MYVFKIVNYEEIGYYLSKQYLTKVIEENCNDLNVAWELYKNRIFQELDLLVRQVIPKEV